MLKKCIKFFILIQLIILLSGCNKTSDYNNQNISYHITYLPTPTIGVEVSEVADESKYVPLENSNSFFDEITSDYIKFNGKSYKIIEVDGGDLSGERKPNVAVNIGYGHRNYWSLTNEYGQLVFVFAEKIILQDEENEHVNENGRYYDDEAKVPGTELPDYDEGHIIADSLGGVSNAYNITPQNSILNRYGNQAYMEKIIRDAGGCDNFIAVISYPDTSTQIPSHYHFEYEINGEKIIEDFDNINPDAVNTPSSVPLLDNPDNNDTFDEFKELDKIDVNGDGRITIAEAKAAGYKMPIYSNHWLYKYMYDGDGDGMVGE